MCFHQKRGYVHYPEPGGSITNKNGILIWYVSGDLGEFNEHFFVVT